MKNKNKLLTMFLASLLLFPACSETAENAQDTDDVKITAEDVQTTETEPAEEDSEKFKDAVPEMTFDGEVFTFLTKPNDGNGYWGHFEFFAEEMTAVPVNDAVFERNKLLEERFDITSEEYCSSNQTTDFRNTVAAQEDAYDCVPLTIQAAAADAINGNLLDFSNLTYVDLDQPWWDPVLNDIFTVGHKQFFAVGDITLVDKEATYIMMFNKDVASRHQIEDLYSIVREGGWTMDQLMDITESITSDADGDGKFTFKDNVGLVTDGGATCWAMYYSSGGTFFKKNTEDMPEFSIDMDRSVRAIEKIHELRASDSVMLDTTLSEQGISNPWSDQGLNGMFKEGRALFYGISLTVMSKMRDMDSDFGVIPYPKLDESDAQYTSYVAGELADCIAVPVTASDPERTSAIIEALCCESANIVMPAYYDVTITFKTARDEQTKEMLDYIFDHRTLDICQLFDWGGIHSALKTVPSADNFASVMKKKEKAAIRAMEKTYEALGTES